MCCLGFIYLFIYSFTCETPTSGMAVSGETRHIPYQGVTGALRTGSFFVGRGLWATGFPRGAALRGPAPPPLLRARRSPAAPPPPSLQKHRFASVRPQEIKIYRA